MTELAPKDQQIIDWIATNFEIVPECLRREHQWMAEVVERDRARSACSVSGGVLGPEAADWDILSFPRDEVEQHLRNLLTIQTLVAQMLESLGEIGRHDLPKRRLS